MVVQTVVAHSVTAAATVAVTLESLVKTQRSLSVRVVFRAEVHDPVSQFLRSSASEVPTKAQRTWGAGVHHHDKYAEYMNQSLIPPDGSFFIIHEGAVIHAPCNGFLEFQEASAAVDAGFNSRQDFQRARKTKAKSLEELATLEESGFDTTDELQSALQRGFDRALESYRAHKRQFGPSMPPVRSLAEFCARFDGTPDGYADADQLIRMFEFGTWKRELYESASSAGFESAHDYIEASKVGIDDPAQYARLRDLELNSVSDLLTFERFEQEAAAAGYNNVLAYAIARRMESSPPGQPETADGLLNTLTTRPRSFGLSVKARLPGIATIEDDPNKLAAIVSSEPVLSRAFFVTGSPPVIYRRWFTQEERKTVVIDLSNVAWTNRNQDQGEKATLRNVLALLNALSDLSFETIIGIADATLPYHIDAAERLDELKPLLDLTVIEGNQSADPHILHTARVRQAVVITNDHYREWIECDEWVAENVPRILLPFAIHEERVVFDPKAEELRGQ